MKYPLVIYVTSDKPMTTALAKLASGKKWKARDNQMDVLNFTQNIKNIQSCYFQSLMTAKRNLARIFMKTFVHCDDEKILRNLNNLLKHAKNRRIQDISHMYLTHQENMLKKSHKPTSLPFFKKSSTFLLLILIFILYLLS